MNNISYNVVCSFAVSQKCVEFCILKNGQIRANETLYFQSVLYLVKHYAIVILVVTGNELHSRRSGSLNKYFNISCTTPCDTTIIKLYQNYLNCIHSLKININGHFKHLPWLNLVRICTVSDLHVAFLDFFSKVNYT